MLDDAIERSKEIYAPIGARYLEQKKTWLFPGGGRLRFRPLERLDDAAKYQGQNVSDACIEEAGLYPDPKPIDRMQGILRSARGVPTQLILTGNPGGPGQTWIRDRYVDPAPAGMTPIRIELPGGMAHHRVYIPSRITDNKLLLAHDPGYIGRLHLVGSEQLVKAWLDGDWSAIEGAFFDCWESSKHVLTPFEAPKEWLRFRSMDWGSASPFSVGWWAVVQDDFKVADGRTLPRGAIVRYREWYGAAKPGVGLKLTAEQVADGIAEREKGDKIAFGVLDPAAFAADGGPSIAERMRRHRQTVIFRPADNKRVTSGAGSSLGPMGGWDVMRARLIGEDETPMLFVFSTCADFIRTVPVLQHDPHRPEDLDTTAEDHVADEARYACMSRPWIPKPKTVLRPVDNSYRNTTRRQSSGSWRV